MKRLTTILITLLIIAYPFAVYFGLNHLSPRYLALGLGFIILLRFVLIAPNSKTQSPAASVGAGFSPRFAMNQFSTRAKARAYKTIENFATKPSLILVTLLGISLSILGAISNQILLIKLYPVAINLMLLAVFSYSLLHPPTIIEKFARLKTANLSATAIQYTRKVTIIWCGFFIINGLLALWTALYQDAKIWAIYNGLISYILIGVLFSAEFIYRQYAKRKNYL
jgi:uncharacterized membrane protein